MMELELLKTIVGMGGNAPVIDYTNYNGDYYFSGNPPQFIPVTMKDMYVKAGSFPEHVVVVDSKTFKKYTENYPPEGKVLGADANGYPTWVDAPPLPRELIVGDARDRKTVLLRHAQAYTLPMILRVILACISGTATNEDLKECKQWYDYVIALNNVNINDAPNIVYPTVPAYNSNRYGDVDNTNAK